MSGPTKRITHRQLRAALDILGLPHDVIEVHIGGKLPTDDVYTHHRRDTWRARVVRVAPGSFGGCDLAAASLTRYEISYVPVTLEDDETPT